MLKARSKNSEFPPNTPSTGSLKICPFGLNLLMKLKFQRKFLKPKRPNFLQVYTPTIIISLLIGASSMIKTFSCFSSSAKYPPPLTPWHWKKSDFDRILDLEVNFDVQTSAQG